MLAEELNSLSGVEFESLCASLVAGLGFQVELTKASGDGGIDIIALNSSPLFRGKYIIQCKRYIGTVGEPILRDLYGVVMSERANKGILMTTGTFTRSAIAFAEGKPIELIDISGIQSLIDRVGYKSPISVSGVNIEFTKGLLDKGLRYYEYCDLQEELSMNPSNLAIRGKIGLLLFSEAITEDYSLTERRTLFADCLYYLEPFRKKAINDIKGQTSQMQAFVCLWCSAQSAFLLGKISEAEIYYQSALAWDDLLMSFKQENHLINCLHSFLVDMTSFYSIIGMKSHAERFLQHPVYKQLFQQKRDLLQSDIKNAPDIQRTTYWKAFILDLDNILTAPNFHVLDIDGKALFDTVSLFDKQIQSYDTDSILNLTAPTLCRMDRADKKITVFTEYGEILAEINL